MTRNASRQISTSLSIAAKGSPSREDHEANARSCTSRIVGSNIGPI